MSHHLIKIIAAALGLWALSPTLADAKTAKACNAEFTTQKAELRKQKIRKTDFVRKCRAEPEQATAPQPTPAPTAPPPPPRRAPKSTPTKTSPPPTPPATPDEAASCPLSDHYVNSDKHCVLRPIRSEGHLSGASARCRDGSESFSRHHSGTCSSHGGVDHFY